MNLKCSPGSPAAASAVMADNNFRAAAGSRNSSTKRMVVSSSDDGGRIECLDLVGIGVTEFLDGRERQQRLGLVDPGHREADVHQYPVVGFWHVLLEQAHADHPAHAADVDLGQTIRDVGDLDDPSRN